jgi:hypothetical protein
VLRICAIRVGLAVLCLIGLHALLAEAEKRDRTRRHVEPVAYCSITRHLPRLAVNRETGEIAFVPVLTQMHVICREWEDFIGAEWDA